MPSLSAYSNVVNTALVILHRKGFQTWYDAKTDHYWAEKDGWDFAASGAVELLGIVEIYENLNPIEFSEYWWKLDSPRLDGKLPRKPRKYRPVWKK